MAPKILPSQEYLRECFDYDPETGVLRWKERPLSHFLDYHAFRAWNGRYANTEAGTSDDRGYRYVMFRGFGKTELRQVHRVIWKWMTGEDPPKEVDHLDLDGANNRWDNLRLATSSQNKQNRKALDNNSTGIKGVHWNKAQERFTASICINYKQIHLGTFKTSQEAKEAYDNAATILHKDFTRS